MAFEWLLKLLVGFCTSIADPLFMVFYLLYVLHHLCVQDKKKRDKENGSAEGDNGEANVKNVE